MADLTRVPADTDAGFNYPYYLHAPDPGDARSPAHLFVEPTNTGVPSDDFDRHQEGARLRASDGYSRGVADALALPYLQPVFPRPRSEPVDWTHSVHQLCARTMRIERGPLKRVDRQLLAMVADARARLAERGLDVPEEIILDGFSASGAFANRFAALHPDRVRSVTAGGLNGLAILPQTSAETGRDIPGLRERALNYPVGVADLAELTGDPFDREAFREVPQFLYMGGDDDKDVLLWPDAWTDPERRATAVLVYGTDVHEDRFPRCQAAYREADVPAVFRIYEGLGHKPGPAVEDLVAFHERVLAGDDIAAIRAALGGGVGGATPSEAERRET